MNEQAIRKVTDGLGRYEQRVFPVDNFEFRDEGGVKTLTGYAAVFNRLSEDLGGFREKIAPGAFSKTIKESDIRALFNHDPNFVLGRTKNNTLSLMEDDRGLRVSIKPPDTTWARDLQLSIQRKDIDQMSFGFRVLRDKGEEVETDKEGNIVVTLKEVRLFDVSPVTFPAYPQTKISARWLEVSRVMQSAERGEELGELQRRLLSASLDVLRVSLDVSAPADNGHPDEGTPTGDGHLPEAMESEAFRSARRRLQLAALI